MYRFKVYIFISVVVPIFLSAAPINKYYISPQQDSSYTAQTAELDIETEFRNKVAGLSPKEREKIKIAYKQKRDDASRNKEFEAAAYYQRLINILNSF